MPDGPVTTSTAVGAALLDATRALLLVDGWPLDDEVEHGTMATTVEGRHGRWVCVAQAVAGRDVLLFTSVLPVWVPVARRSATAEFVARANRGMLVGGFQVDLDAGEIRFVTSLDVTDVDVTVLAAAGVLEGLLRRVVYANVATVDEYQGALRTVVDDGVDPSVAVAAAEA